MLSTLKLSSSTQLTKQQQKKLKQIWQTLHDNHESIQFRLPVNWQGLGLIDYLSIVKNPMDLSTVLMKLENSGNGGNGNGGTGMGYHAVEEVLDDLQLIWDNCKMYNQKGSWIYVQAEKLEKLFKKLVKNHFPAIVLPGQPAKTTSAKPEAEEIKHDDKIKFVDRIKVLKPEQLGLVVSKIQQLCPNAFREVQGQKAQIVMDLIDIKSWKQVLTILESVQQPTDITSKKQKQ